MIDNPAKPDMREDPLALKRDWMRSYLMPKEEAGMLGA